MKNEVTTEEVFNKVLELLIEETGYSREMLPAEKIKKAIATICTKDNSLKSNTTEKWFARFKKKNLISPLRLNIWEINYSRV